MKTGKYIVVFLFCLTASPFAQPFVRGGILFSGNKDVPYEKRTSVNFTPEKPVNLKDKFTLAFDLSIWEKFTYGCIFRAEDKNGLSIWLHYAYHLSKDTSYLILSVNKSGTSVKIPLPRSELYRNNWFRIELTFDLRHNRITAAKNGKYVSEASVKLPKEVDLFLNSGYVKKDMDSPRIALANVALKNRQEQMLHFWKFEEVSGSRAFDSVDRMYAEVSNGRWLAPVHTKWTKAAEFNFSKVDSYGITYDPKEERILFFDNDYYINYDLRKEKFQKNFYSSKRPFLVNHPVISPLNHKIYAYYRGQGQVSEFNEYKKSWSKTDSCRYNDEHYYSHASFINPLNGDLLMFGGYGWFKFSNELRKYNFTTRKWEAIKLKGDFIAPRFRMAVAPYKNKGEFLIIGGTGTNSGCQEEGVKQYYDLFLLNMKDTSLKKIGMLKGESKTYECMNYAWFDNNHTVYFPVFHGGADQLLVNLYVLDLNTMVVTDAGLVPAGKAALEGEYYFMKSNTNELYLIYDIKKAGGYRACVMYKTAWPPVPYEQLASIQSENDERLNRHKSLLYFGAGFVLIAFTMGFVSLKRGWIGKKTGAQILSAESPAAKKRELKPRFFINLFGQFSILDTSGREITNELGPKLREMLQLIILNMKFQGGTASGISSEKLTLLLWPDSDSIRAKNNRNSSMAKLRTFLHRMEGLDIEFSENGWLFVCPDENGCDFLSCLKLKYKIQEGLQPEGENVPRKYLELLAKGSLLNNVSYEWLDTIKASVEKEVISGCFKLASEKEVSSTPEAVLNIIDVILKWDPINEKALRIKIENLIESGRYGEAKSAYELFRSEYRKVFDSEYATAFKDLAE